MLKNKIVVRKIRNIVILLMAIIVMIGTYRNIGRSRAENVIEIDVMAIDSFGYLENEEFTMEAKQVKGDLYEIELPESTNDKVINRIVKVTLEDFVNTTTDGEVEEGNVEAEGDEANTTVDANEATNASKTTDKAAEVPAENNTAETPATETPATEAPAATEDPATEEQQQDEASIEENVLEIVDNKVQVTQEQLENYQVNMEVVYEIALLDKDEEGNRIKILYSQKTDEERAEIEITEEMQTLYSKILRYEDEENSKLVEVKGFLPVEAQLQVEPVTEEQLKTVFGEAKIDVAYDIKIVIKNITQAPVDEANPEAEPEEIVEIIETKPEDFGETCEVTIKDTNIEKDSQVYHVKEDNTYEEVIVKDSTQENIKFDAQHFSIYAVSSDSSLNTTSSTEPDYSTSTDGAVIVGASDDRITPEIYVEGTKISGGNELANGIEPTTAHYGKYVTNYSAGGMSWQIFHYDGTNLYLITDEFATGLSSKISGFGSNNDPHLFEVSGIANVYSYSWARNIILNSDIGKRWMSKMTNTGEDAVGYKVAAVMIDNSKWDSFYKDSTYANYAIGGPTVEMFAESYNAKYGSGSITLQTSTYGGKAYVVGGSASGGVQAVDPYVRTGTSCSYYWCIATALAGLDDSAATIAIGDNRFLEWFGLLQLVFIQTCSTNKI